MVRLTSGRAFIGGVVPPEQPETPEGEEPIELDAEDLIAEGAPLTMAPCFEYLSNLVGNGEQLQRQTLAIPFDVTDGAGPVDIYGEIETVTWIARLDAINRKRYEALIKQGLEHGKQARTAAAAAGIVAPGPSAVAAVRR